MTSLIRAEKVTLPYTMTTAIHTKGIETDMGTRKYMAAMVALIMGTLIHGGIPEYIKALMGLMIYETKITKTMTKRKNKINFLDKTSLSIYVDFADSRSKI